MNFREHQYRFAAHLRNPDLNPAPDDVEDRRLAIYRDLFFNNVRGFISNNFPVLRKLYSDADWDALVRDFFTVHEAHTPLFPELPREFLTYVQEHRGREAPDPPFMLELAHYEWLEVAVQLAEPEFEDVACDPDGDLLQRTPVPSPVAVLAGYQYPVHRISPDFQPLEPPAEATHLVVYRGRDDQVRFMELSAISARLLNLVQEDQGRTGLQCLNAIAAEANVELDAIRQAGEDALTGFRQRDIILGTQYPRERTTCDG